MRKMTITNTHDQEFHDIAIEAAKILFATKTNNMELSPRSVAVALWKDYRVALQALEYEREAEKRR